MELLLIIGEGLEEIGPVFMELLEVKVFTSGKFAEEAEECEIVIGVLIVVEETTFEEVISAGESVEREETDSEILSWLIISESE